MGVPIFGFVTNLNKLYNTYLITKFICMCGSKEISFEKTKENFFVTRLIVTPETNQDIYRVGFRVTLSAVRQCKR